MSEQHFLGTLDARLIALDITTGRPCSDFGTHGAVDLLDGLGHIVDSWEYNVTSLPTIVGDHVIVGSSIADEIRRIQPSGVVRAYNARTGALVWRFNTIPRHDEFGVDTWENESWRTTGGANVWSTMTADLARARFPPRQHRQSRFYRHRSQRCESVFRLRRRPRCENRGAPLAFPNGSS